MAIRASIAIFCWTTVTLLAALLIYVSPSRGGREFDPASPGKYHGLVSANFVISDSQSHLAFLKLNSTTVPQWSRSVPSSWRYERLHVNIIPSSGAEFDRDILLPTLEVQSKEGASISGVRVNPETLSDWIKLDLADPDVAQAIKAVMGFMVEAGNGSLPPPRHHPYFLEQPPYSFISHFTLGFQWSIVFVCWFGIWLLGFVVIFIILRARRKRELAALSLKKTDNTDSPFASV